MALDNLAVLVLQQVGAVAVQHARLTPGQGGGVLVTLKPVAPGFDADDAHVLVVEEGVEQAQRIRPTADTGDQRVRQAAFAFEHLFLGFLTNHRLEVPDHGRVGVWASRRADDVEGVFDVGDPVAQGFVHRVFERAGAGGHRLDLGTEQAHAEYVRRLPLDVGRAHVDGTGQAEQRADRRRCHAVLTRAGLGDDPGLAHAAGEQDLAQTVVDLVRAGVVQLVALEVDLGAAEFLGQPLGKI
ncbi:MAG: Uncharacterised protein [Rhodospirillaceae bacterium]|nr:MAG: Uncharacterised protein [Rhodospirillaceae bacterium]